MDTASALGHHVYADLVSAVQVAPNDQAPRPTRTLSIDILNAQKSQKEKKILTLLKICQLDKSMGTI